MTGTVVSLHAGGARLLKESAASLTLLEGHGAHGDRHAGRDADRALLVTSVSSYVYLAEAGLSLSYGMLGENLVIDGIALHKLSAGTCLSLGRAVLELTLPCPVCKSLSAVDPRLPKLALGRRGIYARVLRGDEVRRGQTVTALALRW